MTGWVMRQVCVCRTCVIRQASDGGLGWALRRFDLSATLTWPTPASSGSRRPLTLRGVALLADLFILRGKCPQEQWFMRLAPCITTLALELLTIPSDQR